MYSSFYSKRWSPASIVLTWILGFMLGMTIWAFTVNPNKGWIMFIPDALLAWLCIWFMHGEENEYNRNPS